MYIVVVTGGIASGKSTVREYFKAHGASTLDLDQISRDIVVPPSPELDALVDYFGDSILNRDGTLNRKELATLAFTDEVSTHAMNQIMFPAIFERVSQYLVSGACSVKSAPVMFIEVPLLTEAPEFAELADEVIAISTSYENRKARALARGMTEDDFEARVSRQATDEEREALADTVFENNGTKEDLIETLNNWWHLKEVTNWRSLRGS